MSVWSGVCGVSVWSGVCGVECGVKCVEWSVWSGVCGVECVEWSVWSGVCGVSVWSECVEWSRHMHPNDARTKMYIHADMELCPHLMPQQGTTHTE